MCAGLLLQINASRHHKLRAYAAASPESLVCLLRHPFVVHGRQMFRRLPVSAGADLASVLAGSVIVEFPTIVILLPGYPEANFPVVNEVPVDKLVPDLDSVAHEESSSEVDDALDTSEEEEDVLTDTSSSSSSSSSSDSSDTDSSSQESEET